MPRNRAGSVDQDYKYFMQLANTDPMMAGKEFLQRLQAGRKTSQSMKYIRQLQGILSDDEYDSREHWQRNSMNPGAAVNPQDTADAIRFVISNALLKGVGLGVINTGPREDVTKMVADMISEDIDFVKWTPIQRRMKILAESYGYAVYQLPEEELVN